MHVLLILKKHRIAFLETSFGQCCYSMALVASSEVCVRVKSATTKLFRVSVGLRQGRSLSRILFYIYMDRMVKNSVSCGGVKIGDCTVQRLLSEDAPGQSYPFLDHSMFLS